MVWWLTGLGGPGNLVYKRSRRGTAEIDPCSSQRVEAFGRGKSDAGLHPDGYDERQYCSPGINLAVGCLSRTPYGE